MSSTIQLMLKNLLKLSPKLVRLSLCLEFVKLKN